MQSLFSACISLCDLMIAYVGISLFDDNPFCLFESPILTIFCCVTVHRFNKKKVRSKGCSVCECFSSRVFDKSQGYICWVLQTKFLRVTAS